MTDDPRIDPADLRNVRFPGSSRRYDARSVDQFLETVASRIAATNVLVDELRQQLADAEVARPAPAPAPRELSLLDEDEIVRLVGEETATVLSTARRAAEEIRSKAEESAARVIREATTEADRVTEEARQRAVELTAEAEHAHERATTEAEEAAARIRTEAEEAAEQLTAETRERVEQEESALEARRAEVDGEVEAILAEAREEGRGMVAEAKEVRSRILEDLQRRRDIARDQIERLLAGRERLLAAYELVRENLDDITGQLADSLPDPGEPELPDGFVGIVGATAGEGAEADEATGQHEETEATADQPDDTVAPAIEAVAPEDAGDSNAGDGVADDVLEDDVEDLEAAAITEGLGADDVAEVTPGRQHGAAEDADADVHVDADVDDGSAVAVAEDAPVEQATTEPDEAPAEDEPVEAAAEDVPAGDVDALFARLRAEREESVARAQEVLGADEEVAAADDEPAEEGTGEAPTDDELPEPVEADVTAHATDSEAVGTEDLDAGVTTASGDVDQVPVEFLATEEQLGRRAEAIKPLQDRLNRALKRRLADEQNELLDLLRRSASTEPGDLLPDEEAQVAGYARVAQKHLAGAAVAGAEASGGAAGVDVGPLADALGRTIVEPFRRRVERAAADVDGDADELDERLRALYREWKAQHVGPAADDALLSAYALGTLQGAGSGTVRWRIDPAQGPCPDAQDNALEGAIPAGTPFPTGDRCPQAHPGCRCLLVAG
jgi:DivIVA domain-containing protein